MFHHCSGPVHLRRFRVASARPIAAGMPVCLVDGGLVPAACLDGPREIAATFAGVAYARDEPPGWWSVDVSPFAVYEVARSSSGEVAHGELFAVDPEEPTRLRAATRPDEAVAIAAADAPAGSESVRVVLASTVAVAACCDRAGCAAAA